MTDNRPKRPGMGGWGGLLHVQQNGHCTPTWQVVVRADWPAARSPALPDLAVGNLADSALRKNVKLKSI